MPARNVYHDAVVHALEADGWTITHDPLWLSYGGRDLFVDLAAEQSTLAAEKGGTKIAVEIQSFLSHSVVDDLQGAVGKYAIYRAVLHSEEPERLLYLAVPFRVYDGFLAEKFGQLIVTNMHLRVLVFDDKKEKITQWIE